MAVPPSVVAMTAQATGTSPIRARSISTWVGVAAIGVAGSATIVGGFLLPFNSAFPAPSPAVVGTMIGLAFATAWWLAAAMTAYAFDRRGRMWVLLLAFVLADWIWAIGWIATPLTWTIGDAFGLAIPGVVFVHALVAFPSGRLRARIERAFVVFVYAFVVVGNLVQEATYRTDFTCDPVCIRNVLFVWDAPGVNDAVRLLNVFAVPLVGLVTVYLVVGHWRSAGSVARRALVPVLVVLPFAYAIKVSGYVGDNLHVQALSDFSRNPPAVALDAIVPIGLIVGIGRARFRRGRVADLMVELSRGVPIGGLRDILARALGDPTLRLGYPAPDGDGFVDADGRPFAIPVDDGTRGLARVAHDGEVLAVFDHDAEIEAESPGLVDAVGSAARLTLENERLAAEVRAQLEEVRASRARIAEAADDERRKVERDLHDGAQQRLVALTMRLEQARTSATDAGRLIDETTAELRTVITEVRQLARGVHPPILTESGLAAAVESLAERTALPVTVRIPERRYPPAIEAAAYFVVAEALTNVGRYAGASYATVAGAVDSDGAIERLTLTIADDGGGGADAARGTGLRGLSDRVAAVGGSLEVNSPAGAGTRITATFPLS